MAKIALQLHDGSTLHIDKGLSLLQIAKQAKAADRLPILGAKINQRLCALDEVPQDGDLVEFLTYRSKEGAGIYQRTASFILNMAVSELYRNARLVIGHSIAEGIYYDLYTDIPVNPQVLNAIAQKMQEIVSRDLPFRHQMLERAQALDYCRTNSMDDAARLIRHSDLELVQIYENQNFANFEIYPLAPSTGYITSFELKTYYPGLILLFPRPEDFTVNIHIGKNKKLFEIYQESKNWGKILGISNVGRLNEAIDAGAIYELIKVAESFHEKKIARIADRIAQRNEEIHLVLVAGPSAAGKTTFSKRLNIQLQVIGIRPVVISVDNYFRDRAACPRDENGEYDFESLEVVDVPLFNSQLTELIAGREVAIPKYDFESGQRIPDHMRLRVEDDQMLIVEGIHCLNEKLTEAIPFRNKIKIYISPLTQLQIDDHNRISTTDTRILRRIVRDSRFRSYTAAQTLQRHRSIVQGERRNIFPFQENADIMFNSALVYELAVLREFALPLLSAISEKEPSFTEAQRLCAFLRLFRPLAADEIPPTSFLREFIGGSTFTY